MKKISCVFIICFLFIISLVYAVSAANNTVEVTIPSYQIIVNNTTIDNRFSMYPFLHYKAMAYLPATFDMCKALSLTPDWNKEKGLRIEKNDQPLSSPVNISCTSANNSICRATIVNYPVTVIGKWKEVNINDGWPVLNFRGITYLPLTWDLNRDLELDYSFDQYGLCINSTIQYIFDFEFPGNLKKEIYLEETIKKYNKYIEEKSAKYTVAAVPIGITGGLHGFDSIEFIDINRECFYSIPYDNEIYPQIRNCNYVEITGYVQYKGISPVCKVHIIPEKIGIY